MPIVQTWIGDEDYKKYLDMKSRGKGEWTMFVHKSLSMAFAAGELINDLEPEVTTSKATDTYKLAATYKDKVDKDLAHAEQVMKNIPIVPDVFGLYPACCLNKKKRCQHWQHNGDNQTWTNTRSGEVVSVDF